MKSYSSERTMKQESGRSKDTEAKLESRNLEKGKILCAQ